MGIPRPLRRLRQVRWPPPRPRLHHRALRGSRHPRLPQPPLHRTAHRSPPRPSTGSLHRPLLLRLAPSSNVACPTSASRPGHGSALARLPPFPTPAPLFTPPPTARTGFPHHLAPASGPLPASFFSLSSQTAHSLTKVAALPYVTKAMRIGKNHLSMGLPPGAGVTFLLVMLAGCPIGCPAGKPQTLYAGPIEDVPLQRTGPCTFRATDPLKHGWKPPPGRSDGFYFVNATFVNQLADSFPASWLSYDEATATFTIPGPDCARGVESLVVGYQNFARTVNE